MVLILLVSFWRDTLRFLHNIVVAPYPLALRSISNFTNLLVDVRRLYICFFIIGDLDRRFNKSSDDSQYYIVLCTGLFIGLCVGLFLKTIYSFSSRQWHTILPFLSAAIAASAFYFGREAYEATGLYDYKGSMIPFAVTMGALLIISMSIYIDDSTYVSE